MIFRSSKSNISRVSSFQRLWGEDSLQAFLIGLHLAVFSRSMWVHAKSLQSFLTLCNSMDCTCQAPLCMEFSRQEYWCGLLFPLPGNLPNQGSNTHLLNWQADSLLLLPPEKPSQEDMLCQFRPPCPSPTPGVYPNPCPSSQWYHPIISSSVVPFSSCPQSFLASGSFPMSQLFASGGQIIGVSASKSVPPMNIEEWSPLGWTGWISLQSKGLSRVSSNTTVQKHQFFSA